MEPIMDREIRLYVTQYSYIQVHSGFIIYQMLYYK